MLVTIIMPAYNCEKYIKQAIDSVLSQTYKNFELLIADDASTDNTKKIIDEYNDPRIKRYHHEENIGYLKATNKLLNYVNGDFICFQDADDYCEPNKIELQLKAMQENNIDACGTSFTRVDSNNKIISVSSIPFTNEALRKEKPPVAPFCTSSIMLTRQLLNQIGGYHEYFDRCGGEDVYWAYNIIDNYNYINLPEKLYYYRSTENSVTNNIPKSLKKMLISPIVTHLILERRNGNDILLHEKYEELNRFIEVIEKPYREDKLLFYKEQMTRYFWQEQYSSGFKIALRIILKWPFQNVQFYKTVFMYASKYIKKVILNRK